MKNKRDTDKAPSDMFVNALSGFGVGSAVIECGFCGREHLCPDSHYENDNDNWKENCEESYKENPDNVVLHYDTDSISAQEINGTMFVIGCPCNGLYRYEQFIWEERDTIRNYLKARIEQEYQWAQQELTKNRLVGHDWLKEKL